MHRIRISLFLLLTSAILLGCGTVERRYVLQGTLAEGISSIVEAPPSKSTSGNTRSQIHELDGERTDVYDVSYNGSLITPLTEPWRDRYKIFIYPGNHKMIVSCRRVWWAPEWGERFRYLAVEFDAIKGHDHAAKCEFTRSCGTFLCEESFLWAEIVDLDTNEAVAKSDERWVTISNGTFKFFPEPKCMVWWMC